MNIEMEKIGMDPKERIARRVAQEIVPGTLVNLGVGLPSMVANYVPAGRGVFFQAENGVIGLGARPPEGMEDKDLTDAGGGFVTAVPGAASIDSAMSFGLIRGGHLDMTVLGGLEVDENGHLANWKVPGKMVVMPRRRTSSGRRGSATATRFCTSTWALSRSVPSLKVTVSDMAPSLVEYEDM